MTHIEDDAVDEAHSKLLWYQDWDDEVTRNVKVLKEKLYSEKEHCHMAEIKQSELKAELENLQKEVKSLERCKETPVSHKWHKWESSSDSDIAEWLLCFVTHQDWGVKDITLQPIRLVLCEKTNSESRKNTIKVCGFTDT